MFSPQSSALGQGGNLIPKDTLAMAAVKVQEIKVGKGRFAKLELTITNGQFKNRKIFINYFADPNDPNNHEKAREIALGQCARALESCGVFDHTNPSSYQGVTTFDQVLNALEGATRAGRFVAIKVGIEKGKDGYEDKNVVSAYLSPNPDSKTAKLYERALAGESGQAAPAAGVAAPAFGGGFGAPAAAPSALAAPGWAGDNDEPPFGP